MCIPRSRYDTGLSVLAPQDRIGPLLKIKQKFWELCTGPDGSNRPEVDFKCYLKYHSRVTRTLSNADDVEEYDEDQQREIALDDWSEDTTRHEVKITGALSLAMFFDSLHEMVHIWAGGSAVSYTEFLSILFENIAYWVVDPEVNEGNGYWAFKDLDNVGAQGDELDELQAAAQRASDADADKLAAALAEAERKRLEQERLDRERNANAEADRLARERKEARDAFMKGRYDRLAALRREQEVIRRQLANSILSKYEDETLRQRLAQIPQDIIEVKIEMIEYDETELVRMLKAGELTQVEDEEHVRQYLADFTRQKLELTLGGLDPEKEEVERRLTTVADRASLVRLAKKLTPEDEAALHKKAMLSPSDVFNLERRLPDIDGKDRPVITLALLEMEVDELNRRMASMLYSPEEVVEMQRRAAEIVVTERKGLLNELARRISVPKALRLMEKTRSMYRCHSRTPPGEPQSTAPVRTFSHVPHIYVPLKPLLSLVFGQFTRDRRRKGSCSSTLITRPRIASYPAESPRWNCRPGLAQQCWRDTLHM